MSTPTRQGLSWSPKEAAILGARWASGYTVPELAQLHKRSYRAIVMQLENLLGPEWRDWNRPLTEKVEQLEAKLFTILERQVL
jgi:hypothetical protein